MRGTAKILVLGGLCLSLSACGGGGLFGGRQAQGAGGEVRESRIAATRDLREERNNQRTSLFNLFRTGDDPNTTVEVNRYLWVAAQDVLNFLPIESVDPFTGVIVTGYGTPPGGGRAYRATIYVSDPALDARSLRVALQGRGGGAVSPETQRAVEDAILTRARQLRIQDARL